MVDDDDRSAPTLVERPRSSAPRSAQRPVEGEPRYTSGNEIGRGGMGRVVEATDTLLGRVVAVKEAFGDDPDALRRFARETRITARLEHPSIVPVYDAGTLPDGSPFYVMRKVSGRPLDKVVGAAGTLNQRLALLPHVLAAAQAIAHAHRRGVVHRDLKPTNILVGELGETVVIDWGLAKVVGEDDDPAIPASIDPPVEPGSSLRTRVGVVFGTPGFMPPEQVRGDVVDARSDVYALGATLYYLLCRRPPHAAPSDDDMMSAAAAGPPTPIAKLVPGVPNELSTIVDKALAFEVDARYPDAGALAEDLQDFLAGQLVASHRYSPAERILRFVRKYRVAVAAVMLALCALVIGGVIAVRRVLAERDRADAQAALATTRQRDAEAARTREQLRGDQLLLMQAQTLAATNPTASVALLKQLAALPRWPLLWRDARAIAADARANGIAYGIPGPLRPVHVEVSPLGDRALMTSLEGEIWVADLPDRVSRKIATIAHRTHTWAGNDHVISYAGNAASLLDINTGRRRDIPFPGGIRWLRARANTILWTDPEQRVSRMDLASGAIEQVFANHDCPDVVVSPDGRWLAGCDARQLSLADLSTSPATVRAIGPGGITLAAWDAASRRLAVSAGTRVGVFELPAMTPTWYESPGINTSLAVTSRTVMVAGGYHGIRSVQQGKLQARTSTSRAHGYIFVAGARDRVIASSHNTIVVLDGADDVKLRVPNEGYIRYATSPTSHYLVASSPGRLLSWDLDQILPAGRAIDDLMSARLLGAATAIGTDGFDWFWIDLSTGERMPVRGIPPMISMRVYANAKADLALVVDHQAQRTWVYRKGEATAVPFAERFVFGMFGPGGQLLMASSGGDVIRYDAKLEHRTVVGSHTGEITALAEAPGWVAAAYVDRIWRRHEATGRDEWLPISRPTLRIVLTEDGRVFYPNDKTVQVWQPDGRITDHATVPTTITGIYAHERSALATTADAAGYTIDLDAPGKVTSVLPTGSKGVIVAHDMGLAVFQNAGDNGEIVDLVVGRRWPLVSRDKNLMLRELTMSGDGTAVMGMLNRQAVLWRIELPQNAAETARWLDELTNASADLGPTTLTWQ